MSLVLILIAAAICIGFAIFMHAIANAPEANEDSNGFNLCEQVTTARNLLNAEVILEPAAARIHKVTAV